MTMASPRVAVEGCVSHSFCVPVPLPCVPSHLHARAAGNFCMLNRRDGDVDDVDEPEDEEVLDTLECDSAAGVLGIEAAGAHRTASHLGGPPSLRRLPPQPCVPERACRVSICVSRCRSSASLLDHATGRLQWQRADDTLEVSVVWLEHSDSVLASPFQS